MLVLPALACTSDRHVRDPLLYDLPGEGTKTVETTPPSEPVRPRQRIPDTANLERFEKLLEAAHERVELARDFHCTLVRREMVDGTLRPEETIDFRQRFDPHALRLEWTGERFHDRRMLYVAGANDDKVQVRLGGRIASLKVWKFDCDAPTLKAYSRYTPDKAGYDRLLARLLRDVRAARRARAAAVAVFKPEMRAGHRIGKFEMTVSPTVPGLDLSRLIVWFDLDTGLLARVVVHDAVGQLVEDYDWRNARVDVGLTDEDFTI
jgi:hypothetical protein